MWVREASLSSLQRGKETTVDPYSAFRKITTLLPKAELRLSLGML